MSNIKKLMMSAAGGGALNVEDVFSTYLYTGNGSAQTITNGIDLAGEGGMVWTKSRSQSANHVIVDTAQGAYASLAPNSTSQKRGANTVTAFSSSGYTVTNDTSDAVFQNTTGVNGQDYASWTFRKAPKFFDVVTWTGDGTSGRTISHNLGSVPGMIIVKNRSAAFPWAVYHRKNTTAPQTDVLTLNETYATLDDISAWNDTAPTDSVFTVGGSHNNTNSSYVAYIFAHNDGDGEFGPDGDADIIKCGGYTGNNNYPTDPIIDLGFEPQWLLIKSTSSSGSWYLFDNMRGMTAHQASGDIYIKVDQSQQDVRNLEWVAPTSRGFRLKSQNLNSGGTDYIYMAIRRGTKVPESATEVFDMDFGGNPAPPLWSAGFSPDMALLRQGYETATDNFIVSRLTQSKILVSNNTFAQINDTNWPWFDIQNGVSKYPYDIPSWYAAMWKRAPGFFDVVAYNNTGNYAAQPHNLGVVPELVIMKRRLGSVGMAWYVTGFKSGKYLELQSTAAEANVAATYTTHTTTHFIPFNESDCIAYLFATLAGVSKVGSYTGNGSSQTIDCGFTAGARFILVKRTDSTGNWYVWDTLRGIVSGNDPYLELNTTSAQVTSNDSVDPANSGFIVNQNSTTNINVSSANYIFYAVA